MGDDSSTSTWWSDTTKPTEEEDRAWKGQPPCVSHLSPLGCLEHNPQRWPVDRDARLPPTEPRRNPIRRALKSLHDRALQSLQSRALGVSRVSADVPEVCELTFPPSVCSRLPFDAQSYDTLVPLHPTMPYHLAFYHLDCVRRELFPDSDSKEVAFVSQLSCSGTGRLYGGTSTFYSKSPEYKWSSEVYFNKGTFLQKQEISCVVEKPFELRSLKFTACPHHKFRVEYLYNKERNDVLVARGCVYFNEGLGAHHWDSKKDGPHIRTILCTSCDSDHEQILAVRGQQLSMRITTYKNLGAGRDRSQPEWNSVLHGQPPCAGYRDLDQVFGRVWNTAKALGRPNLHTRI